MRLAVVAACFAFAANYLPLTHGGRGQGQSTSRNAASRDAVPVITGEVRAVDCTTEKHRVNLSLELSAILTNEGTQRLLLLAAEPFSQAAPTSAPNFPGWSLFFSPDQIAERQSIAHEYFGASYYGAEFSAPLKRALQVDHPPTDKVIVLAPGAHWVLGPVEVRFWLAETPQYAEKTDLIPRKSWSEIARAGTVWLRLVCVFWPVTMELREKGLGEKLRERWRHDGVLVLQDTQSEAIAVNLPTGPCRPVVREQLPASPTRASAQVASSGSRTSWPAYQWH